MIGHLARKGIMKTIAITGTTSGIGKAIVEKFNAGLIQHGEGWNVIRLDRRNLDVGDVEAIQNLDLPALDVFINNAGLMLLRDFPDTSLEDWNRTIDVNLRGVFFLSQKVIPLIKDKGHLINISSIAGTFPEREFMAYNVSKAGVTMLTQCLSKRYGDRIFVNSISPGFVNTYLTKERPQIQGDRLVKSGTLNEPTPQHLIDDIPMQRQAEPEEVADLVWYMVHSKYFNGSDVKFDGGLTSKYFCP